MLKSDKNGLATLTLAFYQTKFPLSNEITISVH